MSRGRNPTAIAWCASPRWSPFPTRSRRRVRQAAAAHLQGGLRGTDRYRGAISAGRFDEPWELMRGIWTFQLFRGGRLLAEQNFTVIEDPGTPTPQRDGNSTCFQMSSAGSASWNMAKANGDADSACFPSAIAHGSIGDLPSSCCRPWSPSDWSYCRVPVRPATAQARGDRRNHRHSGAAARLQAVDPFTGVEDPETGAQLGDPGASTRGLRSRCRRCLSTWRRRTAKLPGPTHDRGV